MPSAFNASAAAICATMMPFASQDPRPYMRSGVSDEAMNGGTVSMCVENASSGRGWPGFVAHTLKRSPSTGMHSTLYPIPASSSAITAPTTASWPVIDSMSMSLRVSANRSMPPEYRIGHHTLRLFL
jgi:hypothetical protein